MDRRNYIAGIVLSFVGSIFILKYGGRHSTLLGAFAVIYLPLFLLAVRWMSMNAAKLSVEFNGKTYRYFLACLTLIAAVLVMILPEKSDVSRLAAISGWLKTLLGGHFPVYQ